MGLLNRKTEKVSSKVLEAGEHKVKVISMTETTDQRADINSAIDEAKEGWKDATPQIAIVFGSTSGAGVFTHRYNLKGFKRFSEMSEKEQKLCNVAGDAEYAVSKKTGMRIEDAARTAKAWESVDRLAANAGLPVGTELQEAIGREVIIMIGENDNGRLIVKYTKKSSAAVMATVEEDDQL